MNTHPEQWAAMLQRPGSSWGFGALLKDTSVVVLKEDTPPTNNPCRTWDSNPQPSGYKSDSLSIRPRLPPWINLNQSESIWIKWFAIRALKFRSKSNDSQYTIRLEQFVNHFATQWLNWFWVLKNSVSPITIQAF